MVQIICIINRIKTLYLQVINTGITIKNSSVEQKRIKLINIYAVIFIHISFLFSLHDAILNIPIDATIGHFVTIFIMTSCLYLNRIYQYDFAKYLWLSYSIISIALFSIIIEPGAHTEYFLLLFPSASLAIFSKKTIGYILLPIVFFLFCIPYYIVPAYEPEVVDKMQISVEFIFTICIFMMVVYFKNLNDQNEGLLLLEKDKVLSDKIILQQQQKELKQLNKFKSHVFVNLSHEIRTPLTLIQGYSKEIDLVKDIDRNQHCLKIINQQVNEIKHITDSILDLSKLEENKIVLHKKENSIKQLLQKCYSDFKPLFIQKNIQFQLIESVQELYASFDFDLFSKSLNNIINNALKFTPENGIVQLIAQQKGDHITIKITDSGIGIPKSDVDKIFNRFYQSENDITQSSGSGIGLAFTKNIIEQHQFQINVESQVKHGTTFSINIPKISTKLHTSPLKKAVITATKTILIVDDHDQMLDYLSDILSNYKIIKARNGKEALDIIKQKPIDLLLTDYMMPVMDGWELVRQVKQLNFTFPVFVITARVDIEGKLKMLRLGIDQYLTKPFLKEELLYGINKSLSYYHVVQNEKSPIPYISKEKNSFYNNLADFINHNLNSSIFGIEEIALHFNISSKTLTRRTKQYFGQTPNQIIIEARLLKAKQILENAPDTTLNQLTTQVGLKNTSYLKKRFNNQFEDVYI